MNGDSLQHLEQKYVFVEVMKEVIVEWLQHACVRDNTYSTRTVSSIYYDTPALALYDGKRNGDFLKSKVRLRWYADEHAEENGREIACFLEVKRKYGSLCKKERLELPLPAEVLANDPFQDEEILDLPNRVRELGYLAPGVLVPTLLIRYHRRRFLDPRSGSRIVVDTDICASRVNDAYLPAFAPIYPDVGVLEVKGNHRGAFDSLAPIRMHIVKTAFSKYAFCLEQLMQPLERRI